MNSIASAQTFTREQLYELVWSMPMTKAAEGLGITSTGLAKICQRLEVPCPYRGYWAKRDAGKNVIKLRLQPPKGDVPASVTIRPTPPPVADPVEAVLSDVAPETVPEVRVADRLRNPHPIIAAKLEEQKRRRIEARGNRWLAGLIPPETELDRRMLRITDALYKALEKRGHVVGRGPAPVHQPFIKIAGEQITFALRERIRQRKEQLTPAELKDPNNAALNRRWRQVREPTGQLMLTAEAEYRRLGKTTWSDEAEQSLEAALGKVVVGLEAIATVAANHRSADREAERLRQQEYDRRARLERLRRQDDKRWLKVREMAATLEETDRLTRFLDVVAAAMEKLPEAEPRMTDWLAWAKERLAGMHPLADGVEAVVATTEAVTEWS